MRMSSTNWKQNITPAPGIRMIQFKPLGNIMRNKALDSLTLSVKVKLDRRKL